MGLVLIATVITEKSIYAYFFLSRADYWKSQAKKFCDFCKCWIADNRPSIDFHEKGKRHKENVTQRLKEIGKKSAKEHKNMLNMDEEMKKMEQAALEAYRKDIEANADFTSQLIKEQVAEKEKLATEEEEGDKKNVTDERENENAIKKETGSRKSTKLWYEAVSDQGYTYYWHIESGESVWEPPEEGYMTLTEQKGIEQKELKKQMKEERKVLKKQAEEERQKKEEAKQKVEEERAFLEREKMKSRRVKEEKIEECPVAVFGPAPRIDPYGKWKTVETRVQEPVDLQLPQQEHVEVKVPVISEPRVKFKEKTIESLAVESGTSSSFKKRKGNSNFKRNMRQRLDDE